MASGHQDGISIHPVADPRMSGRTRRAMGTCRKTGRRSKTDCGGVTPIEEPAFPPTRASVCIKRDRGCRCDASGKMIQPVRPPTSAPTKHPPRITAHLSAHTVTFRKTTDGECCDPWAHHIVGTTDTRSIDRYRTRQEQRSGFLTTPAGITSSFHRRFECSPHAAGARQVGEGGSEMGVEWGPKGFGRWVGNRNAGRDHPQVSAKG